jgi:hypothetical protein
MHVSLKQQAAGENTPPEQLRTLVNQSIEILRLVAKNPNANPELVRELADSNYETIREAVTSKSLHPLFDIIFCPNTILPIGV